MNSPPEISGHEFKAEHGPWLYAFLQILFTAWMQESERFTFNQGWGFTNQVEQRDYSLKFEKRMIIGTDHM